MGWIDTELVLVALAAMVSPTTLTFSVLALVLGDRPLRTGVWFYLGAFGITMVIGVIAAFVIGDVATSSTPSSPKTWVAVIDVIAAVLLLLFAVRFARNPLDQEERRRDGREDEQGRVVTSHRGHRRGRDAGKPGRLHPGRAEDHLGARSQRDGVHRRLAVLRRHVAATAPHRDPHADHRAHLDEATC